MAENRLLDTNVLVYAYDASETRRRAKTVVVSGELCGVTGGVEVRNCSGKIEGPVIW